MRLCTGLIFSRIINSGPKSGLLGMEMTPGVCPAALADGILRLLGDDALRAALVRRAAQRASEEFGQDSIMAQYLDLYRRLLRA